ncbi:MAG: twin-arginine translocase TatA/TatE family subunit [Candidatus Acidiferrales bacterium]
MLSMSHLVIIFLVALIVFGPEKLPELARNFGKVMAEFRRATGDLRAGFEEHMRELERETRLSEAKRQQTVTNNASSAPQNPALPPGAETLTQPAPSVQESAEAAENKILPPAPSSAMTDPSSPAESSAPEAVPQKATDGNA